jgi:hypothetical protein
MGWSSRGSKPAPWNHCIGRAARCRPSPPCWAVGDSQIFDQSLQHEVQHPDLLVERHFAQRCHRLARDPFAGSSCLIPEHQVRQFRPDLMLDLRDVVHGSPAVRCPDVDDRNKLFGCERPMMCVDRSQLVPWGCRVERRLDVRLGCLDSLAGDPQAVGLGDGRGGTMTAPGTCPGRARAANAVPTSGADASNAFWAARWLSLTSLRWSSPYAIQRSPRRLRTGTPFALSRSWRNLLPIALFARSGRR